MQKFAVACLFVLVVTPAFAVGTHSSAVPIHGTYSPAKHWFQPLKHVPPTLSSSADRAYTSSAQPIAEWERQIIARLSYRVTLQFEDRLLTDIAEIMSDAMRVNIILSNEARNSARTVDLKVNSIRAALALNWVCRLAECDWRIMDEAVFIYAQSQVESEETETPSLEEILEALEENSYEPPDFVPRHDPFGRGDNDPWDY